MEVTLPDLTDAPHRLVIASSLQELSRVREFLRSACEDESLPDLADEKFHSLAVALTEVVTNVIRHGYEGVDDQQLECRIAAAGEQVYVQVLHSGASFTPPAEIPELTAPAEGGMGLYIISMCVDEVVYGLSGDGRQMIHLRINTTEE